MDPIFGNADHLIATDSGHFVSQKWKHLGEMIDDYADVNFTFLELRWIPPAARTSEDGPPYVVVGKQRDGMEYAVMYAWEHDDPVDVMARIFFSHNKHGDVVDRMEARNKAAKLFEMRKLEDEMAAKEDLAKWMLQSNKNSKTYRNKEGELIRLDSDLNHYRTRKSM